MQGLVHHLLSVGPMRHLRSHLVTLAPSLALLLLHLPVVHVFSLVFNNVKHCTFLVLLHLFIQLLFGIIILIIVVLFIVI